MQLIIGGVDVGAYIQQSGISESYEKVYDTGNQFTAADGTEIKRCLGVRKSYSVSLDKVPLKTKNMLRSRSRYGYISCTVGETASQYLLTDFSAQVVIQYEDLNLWAVKLTLKSKDIDSSSSGYSGIYSVTCGGTKVSMENNQIIGDIRISNNSGGFPASGIVASQLTFTIDIDKFGGVIYFDPSASCEIGGFDAPTYYVTGRSLSGNEYTITATDRTIFLDLPFNYTTLADHIDSNGNVAIGEVVSEIARQAGFTSGSSGSASSVLDKIPYADLATTCRSILDTISQIACGVWYCTTDNALNFYAFGSYVGTFHPSENQRTDVMQGLTKGPICGVLMINNSTSTDTSEEFSEGSTGGTYHAIKVVSKYANAGRCRALYDRVSGAKYRSFSVSRSVCSTFLPVGTLFYEDEEETYIATNISISLSYTGAYASIGADNSSETEWDFNGALTRQVNAQIEAGRKYHGISISQKDGFVCEGAGGKITMSDGTMSFWFSSEPIVNEG